VTSFNPIKRLGARDKLELAASTEALPPSLPAGPPLPGALVELRRAIGILGDLLPEGSPPPKTRLLSSLPPSLPPRPEKFRDVGRATARGRELFSAA
jgi:hypothetical protein